MDSSNRNDLLRDRGGDLLRDDRPTTTNEAPPMGGDMGVVGDGNIPDCFGPVLDANGTPLTLGATVCLAKWYSQGNADTGTVQALYNGLGSLNVVVGWDSDSHIANYSGWDLVTVPAPQGASKPATLDEIQAVQDAIMAATKNPPTGTPATPYDDPYCGDTYERVTIPAIAPGSRMYSPHGVVVVKEQFASVSDPMYPDGYYVIDEHRALYVVFAWELSPLDDGEL